MWSFLGITLPAWAWLLIVAATLYAAYRWYKYKKDNAYTPSIMHGADVVISTRDNPPKNASG